MVGRSQSVDDLRPARTRREGAPEAVAIPAPMPAALPVLPAAWSSRTTRVAHSMAGTRAGATRNKRARGSAGAGGLRLPTNCGSDFSTPYPAGTTWDPRPRCGATAAVIGPGAGPHDALLRCLRGYHLR